MAGIPLTAAGDNAHAHASPEGRRLAFALALALLVLAMEVAGSVATRSLALLADAGHVLADAGALALALTAVRMAARPHSAQWTFGFHRAEVLAAALNGLALLAVSAYVVWRAAERLRAPAEVEAGGLVAVAAAGLAANVVMLLLLGHAHSLNARAARMHVVADLGGSVMAVAAGVVIALTGWQRADAVLSLAIVALIVAGAVRVLYEAASILMDRVPAGFDLDAVEGALRELDGVRGVHDTHCWTITTGFVAFACHLQVAPGYDSQRVVDEATLLLRTRFGMGHVTVQPDAAPLYEPL